MELQYAPPAKSETRAIWVIAAGLATTAVALLLVFVLAVSGDVNIMGWHANYILPIGAILVGCCASSGYGVASYFSGLKIRRSLLLTILFLQFGAYFGAEYVNFLSLGPLVHRGTNTSVTFFEYFDTNARNFAWAPKNGREEAEPLGTSGYIFIGLEIIGFAAGSLIVPAALMNKPYCDLCQLYMKEQRLAIIPASVAAKKVNKKDQAAVSDQAARMRQASEAGENALELVVQQATDGDAGGLRHSVDMFAPNSKASDRLPLRFHINLIRCRGCGHGRLVPVAASGQGKQLRLTRLPITELTRDFIDKFSPHTPA